MSMGQGKDSESSRGIELQTFRFLAPMLYHWVTRDSTLSKARSSFVTCVLHTARISYVQSVMRVNCKFFCLFFSFFFCFVLSLFQDEKNPTLIHYLVKNLPIPQILFYTVFVCYLMWCESREFLISSRMARSNKKRKLLRIGIIKIYDDWNNFSFRFRNARMTFARCSGNGVNGKSTRCHWKKKHGSFFWPFQFDLISSALVVKY